MSNNEIIMSEKILKGINEDLHTYQKWQSLGYQVKKGENDKEYYVGKTKGKFDNSYLWILE